MCLKSKIQELPERKERRGLHAETARYVVSLKTPKFAVMLSSLLNRWGQHVPKALYNDEEINGMLLQLENIWLAPLILNAPYLASCLDWRNNSPTDHFKPLPLPILGLEFTLTFYFPTTPINLSGVKELYLDGRKLAGNYILLHWLRGGVLPPWISRMNHIECLDCGSFSGLRRLPPWILKLRKLKVPPKLEKYTSGLPRPPRPAFPRLFDFACIRLREAIESGADWTGLQDLHLHWLNGILNSSAGKATLDAVQFRSSAADYLFESLGDEKKLLFGKSKFREWQIPDTWKTYSCADNGWWPIQAGLRRIS
jgi:hypothetical protein